MARQKKIVPHEPDETPEGFVALIAPEGFHISFEDYEEIHAEDGVVLIPEEHEELAITHGCQRFPQE